MRAFIMEGYGPWERARIGELAQPSPQEGELLIRVAAAGVNPADWKEMAGALANYFPPYPDQWAAGMEGAGVVETVGQGVTGFGRGDRVVFYSDPRDGKSGSYAEYVRVNARFVAHVPAEVPFQIAAVLPIAGVTAYQALFLPSAGAGQAGQTVFVYGASGGLGSFTTSIGRAAGLRVLGACRRENMGVVRDWGADEVFDRSADDLIEQVKRAAPGGVDIVFDTNSGGARRDLLEVLRPGGALVVSETATHDRDLAALEAEAAEKSVRVHYLILDHYRITQDLDAVMGLLQSGQMRAPDVRTFPLEEAPSAFETLQSGRICGKIALTVADLA